FEVEIFAAAAFRRRGAEIGVIETGLKQVRIDLAGAGPGATHVARAAVVSLVPCVEQAIGGSGIEPMPHALRPEYAQVGNAAEVEHTAGTAVLQYCGVECRREGRALAASRDVGAAKIGHRADARPFGDHRGIANLQGEGMRTAGPMPDGLAMRSDGGDRMGWDIG